LYDICPSKKREGNQRDANFPCRDCAEAPCGRKRESSRTGYCSQRPGVLRKGGEKGRKKEHAGFLTTVFLYQSVLHIRERRGEGTSGGRVG